VRRLSILLAVVGLLAALVAPGTIAASSRPIEYLALGDSLAFGYNPYLDPFNPDGFVGYPDTVAAELRDGLTNASCPGETSSHFISLTGADHGCGIWRSTYFAPLHTAYATSQLDFADAFLAAHPKTQLITLDLGANDVGALRDECFATASDPLGCISAGMPAMLATLSANLDTIYSHIRNVDGYRHKIVGLTIYSPDYRDPLTTGAIMQVNQIFAERTLAWGGIVADGFAAFAAASAGSAGDTCAAGLRIPLVPPPGCDDHPSAVGRDLLAQTIVQALRED
jgi:lysophospholipase L1-like esterase